jgi:hypothetical protein
LTAVTETRASIVASAVVRHGMITAIMGRDSSDTGRASAPPDDTLSAALARAAGQAIAALIHGAPIASVDVDGIEVPWPDVAEGDRPRAEILSDIAIGMVGIASESAYRFGRTSSAGLVWNRFTVGQIEDFAEIHTLIEEMDPSGEDDVLFAAWRQAVDLMADSAAWTAVEALAEALQRGEKFSGSDVARIVNVAEVISAELRER